MKKRSYELIVAATCETGSQQGDGTPALVPECLVPSVSVNLAIGLSFAKLLGMEYFSKAMTLTVYHRPSSFEFDWMQVHPRTRRHLYAQTTNAWFLCHHILDLHFLFNEDVRSFLYMPPFSISICDSIGSIPRTLINSACSNLTCISTGFVLYGLLCPSFALRLCAGQCTCTVYIYSP